MKIFGALVDTMQWFMECQLLEVTRGEYGISDKRGIVALKQHKSVIISSEIPTIF